MACGILRPKIQPDATVRSLNLNPGRAVGVLAEAEELGNGDACPSRHELQGRGVGKDLFFVVETGNKVSLHVLGPRLKYLSYVWQIWWW